MGSFVIPMTPPRLEFGGTPGVVAIILLSHLAAFYVLLCVCAHGGALFLPTSPNALLADLRAHATPTPATVAAYLGFLATQAVLAMTLPGAIVLGLPIETEPFDVVYGKDHVMLKDKETQTHKEAEARSIHWSPYDRVGVVNADP